MEVDKCIRSRRSIRRFKPDPVPRNKINRLIESGIWAPSGLNTQPWCFFVIEDRDVIRFLSDATKSALLESAPDNVRGHFMTEEDVIFYNAPLLVLICVESNPNMHSVHVVDCAMAAENMLLRAVDLGLGGCYIGWANNLNRRPEALQRVGVPGNMELMSAAVFGVAAEEPIAKLRRVRVLRWIK